MCMGKLLKYTCTCICRDTGTVREGEWREDEGLWVWGTWEGGERALMLISLL